MTRSRPERRWVGGLAGGVVWSAIVLGASASGPPVASNAIPPAATHDARTVFVALGGDETLNRGLDDSLRRAWTQQVFGTTLGPSAVYVNLATPDATVREGLSDQLPKALELQPTLATIWFGMADGQSHTTDAGFESDLTEIVQKLQAGGATKVLLLSRTDPTAGDGSRYAADIQRVASLTHADFLTIPVASRNPRDPATQQAIADAVRARLGN